MNGADRVFPIAADLDKAARVLDIWERSPAAVQQTSRFAAGVAAWVVFLGCFSELPVLSTLAPASGAGLVLSLGDLVVKTTYKIVAVLARAFFRMVVFARDPHAVSGSTRFYFTVVGCSKESLTLDQRVT